MACLGEILDAIPHLYPQIFEYCKDFFFLKLLRLKKICIFNLLKLQFRNLVQLSGGALVSPAGGPGFHPSTAKKQPPNQILSFKV